MLNNNQHIDHEFEVLDFKVKFKAEQDKLINATHVVELVRREAVQYKEMMPNLTDGEVLLLVALKFAEEKMVLEEEYKGNIETLYTKTKTALDLVDKMIPTLN